MKDETLHEQLSLSIAQERIHKNAFVSLWKELSPSSDSNQSERARCAWDRVNLYRAAEALSSNLTHEFREYLQDMRSVVRSLMSLIGRSGISGDFSLMGSQPKEVVNEVKHWAEELLKRSSMNSENPSQLAQEQYSQDDPQSKPLPVCNWEDELFAPSVDDLALAFGKNDVAPAESLMHESPSIEKRRCDSSKSEKES